MLKTTLKTMSTREVNQNLGAAKKSADEAPLLITERGEAGYVLMNYQQYLEVIENNRDSEIYNHEEADNMYKNITEKLSDIDNGVNGVLGVFSLADNIIEVLDKIDKTHTSLNNILYQQKQYEHFIEEFYKSYKLEKIE